jgi:putative transposon-encoded protein/succinate dehydrogenase flavin-adding protein (antitoxin of CptAB toxin-antitoxin module)
VKIRITKDEAELEGVVEKGFVKPFGTSAHIPFRKKHFGKEVFIVVPSEPKYCWLITDQKRKKLISSARRIIQERDGRLEHHYLEYLEDLSKEMFDLQSLIKIVQILEEVDIERELIKEIKILYSI